MRAKLLVGFVMLAAAAPLCAQAAAVADAASKADVWNSWRAGPAEPPAMHARVARQSDSAVAAMGESVASFSVPRVMTGSATTAPSRAVQATVAPEMNTGFAAAGLTLLLGGVAVLRGGPSRFNG